jgi:integrase
MRRRIRYPKIRKENGWYTFRITNSFGKRIEVKSATKEQAQLKLAETTKQIISSLLDEPTYRVTFEQGIEFWMKYKKNTIVDNSLSRDSIRLRNFVDFVKKEYPQMQYYDESQKEDSFALGFRDYRLGQGRATKTVKDEEATASSLYKFLIKKKKIPNINPFEDLEPLAVVPVQDRRMIPNDKLKKFFEGANKISEKIFWYGVFMVIYFTGMRRDEVRLMEKSWVNFETGHFEIPKVKMNKKKVISKTVPIHPQVRPMVEEAIARSKSKYVFPDEDGEVMPKNKIRDTMHKICKTEGIPMTTPHDFRHTWSTKSRLAGMSNEARREIGGWSSDEIMEKTYTHYPKEKIRAEYFGVNFLDFMNEPEN